MSRGKCKNCGGDEGIHRWDTMQCPFGGREAPYPRETQYTSFTFEPESDELDSLREQLASQAETIAKLREALREIASLVTNHESGHMKEFQEAEEKARAILAETEAGQ